MKTYPVNKTYLQMILSVRSMRLVIPLLSFLLIWRATHTGVSGRARLRGVSPSLFMMSMSAPLDRNNLKMKERKKHHSPWMYTPLKVCRIWEVTLKLKYMHHVCIFRCIFYVGGKGIAPNGQVVNWCYGFKSKQRIQATSTLNEATAWHWLT